MISSSYPSFNSTQSILSADWQLQVARGKISGVTNIVRNAPFTASYLSTRVTPRPYPEKSGIQWQCASSATSAVGLQIEGLLIPNNAP